MGFRLGLSDNQTVPVNLPSSFGPLKFYGQRYTRLSVCSNGWIAPGMTTVSTAGNAALPSALLPVPAICANWDDLNPAAGGDVWAYHDEANHAYVIEYDNVVYSDGSVTDKFEIVIFDTTRAAADGSNVIVVQYMTANGYTSSTIGIQDQTQTYGINCLCDAAYHRGASRVEPLHAVKYTTDAPNAAVEERPAMASSSLRPRLGSAPNPFGSLSHVWFSLPVAGRARLSVYDVNGQESSRLIDAGALRAGTYSARWNGLDADGLRTANGVYVYRLETSQGTLEQKVVKLE